MASSRNDAVSRRFGVVIVEGLGLEQHAGGARRRRRRPARGEGRRRRRHGSRAGGAGWPARCIARGHGRRQRNQLPVHRVLHALRLPCDAGRREEVPKGRRRRRRDEGLGAAPSEVPLRRRPQHRGVPHSRRAERGEAALARPRREEAAAGRRQKNRCRTSARPARTSIHSSSRIRRSHETSTRSGSATAWRRSARSSAATKEI